MLSQCPICSSFCDVHVLVMLYSGCVHKKDQKKRSYLFGYLLKSQRNRLLKIFHNYIHTIMLRQNIFLSLPSKRSLFLKVGCIRIKEHGHQNHLRCLSNFVFLDPTIWGVGEGKGIYILTYLPRNSTTY